MRRRGLATVVVVGSALAACSSASAPSGHGAGSHPTTPVVAGQPMSGGRSALTFRPVIEMLPPTGSPPTTPRAQITDTGTVVLASRDPSGRITARYELGPVLLNGTIISHATVEQNQSGQWQVDVTMTTSGSTAFDAMAGAEYQKQVAMVLDGLVLEAPEINATSFHGVAQGTGDLTASEARALAQILNTPGSG